MTRNRIALGTFLLATILSACGGRSLLRVTVDEADGGGEDDGGGKRDGKRDGGAGDGLTKADVSTADAPITDLALANPDAARGDARLDGRPSPLDLRSDGSPAPLTSLELTPANPTIAAGIPYASLQATAIYADGTTADVTAAATYSSSDTAVLQVSGSTLTGKKAGSATLTASYGGKIATTKVTVSSAALASISIDGSKVVSVGQYALLTATGVLNDGTKQDISSAATWKSSDTGLAQIALDSASGKAKLTGAKAGTVTVTATYQNLSGTTQVTVTAAALSKVDVTPVQPIMQKGTSREFQATATYADGTTGDVTPQATWTTSDAAIASVTAGASTVVVRAVATGTTTITAAVGGSKGSTTVTVTAPTLTAITIKPATWAPNVGGTQDFTATGSYSDGSTADLSISVTWASTAATVAAVSNATGSKGRATALAAGSAQVQATLSGVTGSASVSVSASPLVAVTVTPSPLSVVLGLTSAVVATAKYENGITQDVTAQAAWTSADTGIASVSNVAGTAGQVKGLAAGTTTVTASFGGKSGSTSVTVAQAALKSITVAPATTTVTAGKTQQLTATGVYSNGASVDLTTQATWASSDITVAQVSNASGSNGLATALTAGTAKITAALGGVSGGATLTVGAPLLASLIVSPSVASVDVGRSQNFTATAVYENGTTGPVQGESWTSSNPSIATIAAQGPRTAATGVAAGTVTITASYQGKSATATLTVTAVATLVQITVTPQTPSPILVGEVQQFRATAVYSDGTTSDITDAASWTTSNAKVASISTSASRDGGGRPGPTPGGNAGLATGIGAGTATITAVYAGTCSLSCTASTTLTVRSAKPSGLTITPSTATVRVNGTQQFTAILTYDDGTSETLATGVSWTTSDGKVASITSAGGGPGGPGRPGEGGLATGLAAGSAIVTATYDTFAATATLTVVAAKPTTLVVTPAAATITVNTTQAFVATLVYDDGTTAVVTGQAEWSSSNAAVATVTSGGIGGRPGGPGPGGEGGSATALDVGTATITASYGGLAGKATLTVTDPPISYVQVTPTSTNLPVGASQQYVATAVFSDFSTRNVTAQATWASSSSAIAVISGSGPSAGRANTLGEGTATISATYDGATGSTVLTVAKGIKSIEVTPANPTTVLGVPVTLAAIATLTNDTSLVVTGSASWVTGSAAVATVTGGIATPVKAGSATITATYLGVSGTTTLTVSAATLSSIKLTPASLSLAKGGSAQLAATGSYSDGTTYDLTPFGTWLSSTATVATVSNAAGSRGLVTALTAGSTNVTAVFQGTTSSSVLVTVSP